MASADVIDQILQLEKQLYTSNEKVRMRENVIEQLEEEIRAKEQLIHEQGHLINILETTVEHNSQMQHHDHNMNDNSKFDAESITTDSEITIIERHYTSSSPSHSSHSSTHSHDGDRYRERLEQAMIDREKLELQNEQLLKQWEESLEYVSRVQRQLQEEIRANTDLKCQILDMQKWRNDAIVISRGTLHAISVFALFIALYLYSL